MINTVLRINEQVVALRDSGDLPVSIVYSVEGIEDPSKIGGSYARRNISVPGIKKTVEIFGRAGDPATGSDAVLEEVPATVEVGGLPVFKGVAKLVQAARGSNGYRRGMGDHKISLFGNNVGWFDGMKSMKMSDIEVTGHEFSTINIAAGAQNTWIDGYCYGVIKFRNWETAGKVALKEHHPCIFLKYYILEAFRLQGYSVESEFFDTDYFQGLVMPLPLNDYSQTWKDENTDLYALKNIEQGPLFAPVLITWDETVKDGTGTFDGTTYTVPYTGNYRIVGQVLIRYDGQTYTLPGFCDVYVNGFQVTDVNAFELGYVGPLNAGDTVTMYYKAQQAAFNEFVVSGSLDIRYNADFSEYGGYIDPSALLKEEWTMDKVILDLTTIFGLMWDTKLETGVVRVEPKDPYLLPARWPVEDTVYMQGFYRVQKKELTKYMDLKKEGGLEFLGNSQFFHFKYQSGDDTVDALEENNGLGLYGGSYQFPGDRSKPGIEERSLSFFEKTVHIRDDSIRHADSEITPQVPLIWPVDYNEDSSETEGDYDIGPRLLWFGGRREGLDGYINQVETTDPYDYPVLFMVNYNDNSGFDPNLSFSDEAVTGVVSDGLLKRFHIHNMKRKEVGKKVADWFYLGIIQMLDLDFSVKVLVEENTYILTMVDGKKFNSQESTELVLILDTAADEEDLDKVDGSGLRGIIDQIF